MENCQSLIYHLYTIIISVVIFMISLLGSHVYNIINKSNRFRIKYTTTDSVINSNLNDQFKYNYSACFDIQTIEEGTVPPRGFKTFDTGIIMCLPIGYELQIRPRSGLSSKGSQAQFGTIDTDYRGHHKVTIYNFSDNPIEFKRGDRIAQGIISQIAFMPINGDKFIRVKSEKEFDVKLPKDNSRGSNGFGSTGV